MNRNLAAEILGKACMKLVTQIAMHLDRIPL